MQWHSLSASQKTKLRLLLEEYVRASIPGFKVVEKQQSLWMRVLSRFLFFNPDFMSRYTTTLYPKIYVPSRSRWEANNFFSIITLAHEYVHLSDRRTLGILFNLFYLTPQILAVFALLYPISTWFLLFLICLLPIPSIGRAWAEFRGYRMSMAVHYWLTGQKYNITFITHQFVSSSYYWMFPFRPFLTRLFEREFEKIVLEDYSPELREFRNVLTSCMSSVYNNFI
jgi:hypothetical protein